MFLSLEKASVIQLKGCVSKCFHEFFILRKNNPASWNSSFKKTESISQNTEALFCSNKHLIIVSSEAFNALKPANTKVVSSEFFAKAEQFSDAFLYSKPW